MTHRSPPFLVNISPPASELISDSQPAMLWQIMPSGHSRREFTINLISEWFVEAANHTCGNYDRGVNEIELSGLTPIPSVKVWLQWL